MTRTRRLRRLGAPVALLLGVMIALIAPQSCAACSCLPMTFSEAAEQADVVFVGTVTGRDPGKDTELGPGIDVSFAVSEVHKGGAPVDAVVRTADNSAACGFAFEPGQTYLVMARSGPAGLETDLCTGTRLAAEVADEELASLGAPVAPGPAASGGGGGSALGGPAVGEDGSARPWFIAGGATLGALLTALLLWWQRRRATLDPHATDGPGVPEIRRPSPGEALPHTEAT